MDYFAGIGNQPPPEDVNANNAWMAQRNAAFSAWLAALTASLAGRGFSVSVTNEGGSTTIWTTASYARITITRSGFAYEFIASMTTAITTSPEDAANSAANSWGYNYAIAGNGNPFTPQGTIPSPPPLEAGPQATVSPAVNTQPLQAPSTPANGTLAGSTAVQAVAAGSSEYLFAGGPRLDAMLTVHEWNWYLRQRTGITGPAPEDIGIGTDQRIGYRTWESLTQTWLAQQAAGSGGDSITPDVVDVIGLPTGGGADSGATAGGGAAAGGGGVGSGGAGTGGTGGAGTGSTGGTSEMSTETKLMIGGVVLFMVLMLRR